MSEAVSCGGVLLESRFPDSSGKEGFVNGTHSISIPTFTQCQIHTVHELDAQIRSQVPLKQIPYSHDEYKSFKLPKFPPHSKHSTITANPDPGAQTNPQGSSKGRSGVQDRCSPRGLRMLRRALPPHWYGGCRGLSPDPDVIRFQLTARLPCFVTNPLGKHLPYEPATVLKWV